MGSQKTANELKNFDNFCTVIRGFHMLSTISQIGEMNLGGGTGNKVSIPEALIPIFPMLFVSPMTIFSGIKMETIWLKSAQISLVRTMSHFSTLSDFNSAGTCLISYSETTRPSWH